MKKLEGYYRHDVLRLLDKESGCIGVELGVAAGGYSKRMVDSGWFDVFFGVDMYADTHDVEQYKQALNTVGMMRPYKLLRMTFDEAYDLFADESLDFIYIDGYAHSGQEGGDTIYKWARKVRVGGVIAGDDYHDDWPLVQQAVDRFISDSGFGLCVTTEVEPDAGYSEYPSWAAVKTSAVTLSAPQALVDEGKSAAAKVLRKRMREQQMVRFIKKITGQKRYLRLKEWNRERKKRRRRGGELR